MPQELSTKMMEKLPENEVRPFELTKVYATGIGGFHAEGEEIEVHPLLAEKLITQGAATKAKSEKKSK